MSAFANGIEFEIWSSKWCTHCAHDHSIHTDEGGGCELVARAMGGDHPSEWRPPHDNTPTQYVCERFSGCDACGGDPIAPQRAALLAGVTL